MSRSLLLAGDSVTPQPGASAVPAVDRREHGRRGGAAVARVLPRAEGRAAVVGPEEGRRHRSLAVDPGQLADPQVDLDRRHRPTLGLADVAERPEVRRDATLAGADLDSRGRPSRPPRPAVRPPHSPRAAPGSAGAPAAGRRQCRRRGAGRSGRPRTPPPARRRPSRPASGSSPSSARAEHTSSAEVGSVAGSQLARAVGCLADPLVDPEAGLGDHRVGTERLAEDGLGEAEHRRRVALVAERGGGRDRGDASERSVGFCLRGRSCRAP